MKLRENADWLAWSLQFVIGFLAGGSGMLYISIESFKPWLDDGSMMIVIVGSGMFTGAMASYEGDNYWLGFSKTFPDVSYNSKKSRRISMVLGMLGLAFLMGDFLYLINCGT